MSYKKRIKLWPVLVFISICFIIHLPSFAQLTQKSGTKDLSDKFPPGKILVVLKENVSGKVLKSPDEKKNPVIYNVIKKYKPSVEKSFPLLKSKIGVKEQIQALMIKYNARRKFKRLKLKLPETPPLHRFYSLTFPSTIDNDKVITELKKSQDIETAVPNPLNKIKLDAQNPYYSEYTTWLTNYLELFGLKYFPPAFLKKIKSQYLQVALEFMEAAYPDPTDHLKRFSIEKKIKGTIQFLAKRPILETECDPKPPKYKKRCTENKLLVKFKTNVTDAQISKLNQEMGVSVIKKIPFIRVYLVKLPDKLTVMNALKLYAARSDLVLFAEPDYLAQLNATTPNDEHYSDNLQWSLNNTGTFSGSVADADIDADEAWDTTTGSSDVIVAIIDTGIVTMMDDFWTSGYSSPSDCWEMMSNYSNYSNFWINEDEFTAICEMSGHADSDTDYDGNGYPFDYLGYDFYGDDYVPLDLCGHGTEIASLIGAKGNNSIGMAGINWNVTLLPLQVTTCSTPYDGDTALGIATAAIIDAVYYADDAGADVYNMSFSRVSDSASEEAMIYELSDRLFVNSPGNDSIDHDVTPYYPTCYGFDNLIAVAATDNDDTLSSFSNYGDETIHVAAPGQTLLGMDITTATYNYFHGTSYAAAIVSGMAALLWGYAPGLTAYELSAIIEGTVDTKSSLSGKVISGGRVNIKNAIDNIIDYYPDDVSSSETDPEDPCYAEAAAYTTESTCLAASSTYEWVRGICSCDYDSASDASGEKGGFCSLMNRNQNTNPIPLNQIYMFAILSLALFLKLRKTAFNNKRDYENN